MKLLSTKCIWNKGSHNAFTDLCEYNGQYFCCFREAKAHISSEGVLRILVSSNLKDWELASTVRANNADLRDPKLFVDREKRLCILFGKIAISENKQRGGLKSYFCRSSNGTTWSCAQKIGDDNYWLWRLSWYKEQAFGISYGEGKVQLNKGNPNSTFEVVNDDLFSKAKYGKGYPNESDILFLPDDSAVCVLRRDADSGTAQLGRSHFPFTQWRWFDLGLYIGGPALIMHNNTIILAGRSLSSNRTCRTSLWTVDIDNHSVTHQLDLPSDKDTSYPGLIVKDDTLYVSYYSEHINNKSSIYLAELAL